MRTEPRTRLQQLVNAVAKDGQRRRVPHQLVDTRGPINVPIGVNVEGDHQAITIWPDPSHQEGKW